MKSRHEFENDQQYREYLIIYFCGQMVTNHRYDINEMTDRANVLVGKFFPKPKYKEQDLFLNDQAH